MCPDLSRVKPTSQASGKNLRGSDLPPSSPILNEDDLDGQEVNSATDLGSEVAPDDGAVSKNLPLDGNVESGLEASHIVFGGITEFNLTLWYLFSNNSAVGIV